MSEVKLIMEVLKYIVIIGALIFYCYLVWYWMPTVEKKLAELEAKLKDK